MNKDSANKRRENKTTAVIDKYVYERFKEYCQIHGFIQEQKLTAIVNEFLNGKFIGKMEVKL